MVGPAVRVALVLGLVVSGCSGDGGSGGGRDAGVVGPPVLTPGTTVEVIRPITLTEQARLPEQDPELLDVEVTEDRLVFVYRSEVTRVPFAVGDVVAGILHGGYLRRLLSIEQTAPSRIEASTAHAELGELIGDGHFRVSFVPGSLDGDLAPSGEVGAARTALTTGWSGITPEYRNISCSGTLGGTLEIHPRFDLDLGMDLEIDIQWTSRFLIPRGELVSATVAVRGSLEAGLTMLATTNLSASCSRNLTAGLPERFKPKWTVAFALGPIPVIVTHTLEPYAQVTVGADVEVGRTTASAMGSIGLRAGTQFDQAGGWRPIWEPTHSGEITFMQERAGRLTASGSIAAGVKYSLKIYDAFGPTLSLGPNVSATFSSAPDCTWATDAKVTLDLTGAIELSVPFIDWQIASFSVTASSPDLPLDHDEGVLPWCSDAGPPDAGPPDAGTMPDAGPPDAGTMPDAGPLPNGAACTEATQCRSRFCVDGVCCDEMCDSQCRACVASKSRSPDGTCDAIIEDTDPDDECPNLQMCQAYVTTPGATAYCRAHYGDPCVDEGWSADCPGAGFCRTGVCCDNSLCGSRVSPCTSCRNMYTGLAEGDCGQVLAGMDPYDYCTLPETPVCNGMGGCQPM